MVDAMRSPTAGRELVRLGRRGGRLPMLAASVSGRRGEVQAWRRPAPPAAAGPERPRRARSRIRTREIVASAIQKRPGFRRPPPETHLLESRRRALDQRRLAAYDAERTQRERLRVALQLEVRRRLLL